MEGDIGNTDDDGEDEDVSVKEANIAESPPSLPGRTRGPVASVLAGIGFSPSPD